MNKRLPPDLRGILEASGTPWRLVSGARHFKLFVGGRFVAVLPMGRPAQRVNARTHRNMLASVRRALRPAAGKAMEQTT
jgi:hypothetical protein